MSEAPDQSPAPFGAEETISIYDARADAEAFAATLPKGARILDLGCGPGQYAAWFADQGFDVSAWDASASMIALAGQHPGVTARQARFDELNAEAGYDGIWANFSLLHLPKEALPDVLARIHRALKPAGHFHIAMKLGRGAGPDKIGRYYSYYSEEELRDLLAGTGFTISNLRHFSGKGLDGTAGAYITLLCHG
ncbi:class I SAM-dependent methyltransferase [Celeribacter neptunius]|uniref:Methyltransferase domain-containing protein n=1 Tax=Celeribacter neptunius TaxID=588602 RepID=A0A1I3X2G5_9RHOB|nr:class I SAM-dependent methyltransferase [Celeribacter neptunius]SFK13794.1 Methyltransferase domain-containing protein [Celeribacter neptunius]